MQVFKTTLKLVSRFPVYLLLYIVLFGLLGVLITASSTDDTAASSQVDAFVGIKPSLAIIDRDHSEVSESMTSFLEDHATPVVLEDNTKALQDATAQGLSSYIMIIPEGFGEEFIATSQAGTAVPRLETVVNYEESDAIYMDLVVNEYLNALRIAALGAPDASLSTLLTITADTADLHANLDTVVVAEVESTNALTVFFFQWMAFPITTGLIVLTAIIFSVFQGGELRRRNLCSPLSPTKMNAQVALGCVSMVLLTWAFLVVLALLPSNGGMALISENPASFALLALAALVYAFVPFSIGFLLSQAGMKELAFNGVAIIISLTFCFVSGVFMGGVSFLGEGVQVVAHFVPTFWYSEAIHSLEQGAASATALTSYFSSLGIVALFALAFFSVALLVGRNRATSADAGGNPAAEAVV